MKTFISYLLEEKNDKNVLRDIIRANLKLKYPELQYYTSNRAKNELFRSALGLTAEEVKEKINNLFHDSNIKYKLGEFKIFGRDKGASSKYNSIEFVYNNQLYYITTTNNEKGLLRSKDLTPINLGIDVQQSYTAPAKLKNTLKFDKITKISPIITQWLEKIMGEISTNSIIDKTGCFTAKDADEFMNLTTDGTCKIKFTEKTNKFFNTYPILQADINCIIKDFGEILGPLILLKLFKKAKITFPEASNEPLVDYKLNGYKISAKAEKGGGAKPSAAGIFSYALANKKLFNEKEQELIDKIAETFSMDTFTQQKTLIEEFTLPKQKRIANYLKKMKFSTWKNAKDLERHLDEFMVKNNGQEFFQHLYEDLNYIPAAKGWPVDKIVKEWSNINNSRQKWGILFYPLYRYAVDQINIEYGTRKVNEADGTEEKDVISHICQKILDLKQIYLNMNEEEIKLTAKSGNVNNWKLTVGGISTNDINNSKLAIQLTK